jgi:hypothetical protein
MAARWNPCCCFLLDCMQVWNVSVVVQLDIEIVEWMASFGTLDYLGVGTCMLGWFLLYCMPSVISVSVLDLAWDCTHWHDWISFGTLAYCMPSVISVSVVDLAWECTHWHDCLGYLGLSGLMICSSLSVDEAASCTRPHIWWLLLLSIYTSWPCLLPTRCSGLGTLA